MPIRTRRSRPRSSFVAAQAQFTPKTVETKTEREKLMFRVRVRIDPELLARARAMRCEAGCPAWPTCALDPAASTGRRDCRQARRRMSGARALGRAPRGRHAPLRRRARARRRRRSTIPAGCMVGLIGPDGVGKSTLLGPDRRRARGSRRARSRCSAATWRDARHRARDLPAHRLHAAGAGQEPLPDLSVRENVDFFGRLFGQTARERDAAHRRAARQHRAWRRSPTGRPASSRAA